MENTIEEKFRKDCPEVAAQLDKINEYLDNFEEGTLGTGRNALDDNARKCISMSPGELRKLDVDEITDVLFFFNSYCQYIQRLFNRHSAWEIWAESKMDEIVAQELPSMSTHFGWSERSLIVRNTHPTCKGLSTLLRRIRVLKKSMEHMIHHAKDRAELIKALRYEQIKKLEN
jgi:hypothetical protein